MKKKSIKKGTLLPILLALGLVVILLGGRRLLATSYRETLTDASFLLDGEVVSTDETTWQFVWKEDEGGTLTKKGGEALPLGGSFLFSKDDLNVSVLLTDRCILQYAKDNGTFRVEACATVMETEEGILLTDGKETVTVSRGVLYNGESTHLFLEQVTLLVREESISLPALTMVIVGEGALYVYGPNTEAQTLYFGDEDEVTITLGDGKIIYLLTERVLYPNGAWSFLLPDATSFQTIAAWNET